MRILSLIFLLLLLAPSGNAQSYDQSYYEGAVDYYRKVVSSEGPQYRSSWLQAIERFEYYYFNFPGTDLAPKAMYNAAKAYMRLHEMSGRTYDLEQALSTFRLLASRYPQSNLADDAIYINGILYEERKRDRTLARRMYERVIADFSSGDMVPRARARLDSMGIASAGAVLSNQSKRDSDIPERIAVAAPEGDTSGPPAINDVETFSDENYTRAVLRFSHDSDAIDFEKHWLRADPELGLPPRLFLDIRDIKVAEQLDDIRPDGNRHLKAIRIARHDPEHVRVVFDINQVEDFKVFTLQNPTRLVVDLNSEGSQGRSLLPKLARSSKQEAAEQQTAANQEPAPRSIPTLSGTSKLRPGQKPEPVKLASLAPRSDMSLAKQLGLGVRRVVIDAGHGGKDPGAIGFNGLHEKHVVLNIAGWVAEELRRNSDLDVVLTRSSDKFLPLEQRTAIANTRKADLFVSIHANASRNRSAEGIETYFLNITADPDAMEVAARENAISEKSVGNLQGILKDLMMNSKISESERMAEQVHTEMVEGMRKAHPETRDKGVKKAPFYVLIGAQMPSILLEVGFISSRREGQLLAREDYQRLLASNISRGILSYARGQ